MSKLLNAAIRRTRTHCHALRYRLRDNSGQSLIELALVLPVFFMLVIGFINFCMIMVGLCNISYACRQANRYLCVHSVTSLLPATQSGVDSLVAPYIFRYPSNSYINTISYSSGGNIIGGTATVKVTINYNVSMLFLTLPPITLSSTASSVIVQ